MNLFKRALSFLLATIMIIPSGLNIVNATEAESDDGAYTTTLLQPVNGSISFTESSKDASTASQNGYKLMTVDEEGNLIEFENDGSVWAFSKGDVVEVVLTPDDGYNVKSFAIKDATTGDVLASKETTDNMFSFTMPGKNINIESAFVSQDAINVDIKPDKLFGETEYHDVTESDEITRKEIEEVNTDIIVESYIKSNVDTKYTSIDKIELANLLYIKNSLFNGDLIHPNETIDSVMEEMQNQLMHDADYNVFDKFITQLDAISPLYNLSDESEYYVAYANTLMKDNQYRVQDYSFAIFNNDGETIYDCIYDENTGLAYVPKKWFTDENGETLYANIQVQFMQVTKPTYNDDMIEITSSVYTVDYDGKNRTIEIEKTEQDPFELETRFQVPRDFNSDDYNVIINGLPIPETLYEYDETTSEIIVYMTSTSVISMAIEEKEKTLKDELTTAMFEKTVATSLDSLKPNRILTLPDGVAIPPLGYTLQGVIERTSPTNTKVNIDGIYDYYYVCNGTAADQYALWISTIKGNASIDESQRIITNFANYYPHTINFQNYQTPGDDSYREFFSQLGKITLGCGHIDAKKNEWAGYGPGTSGSYLGPIDAPNNAYPFALQVVKVATEDSGSTVWTCQGCGATFESAEEANAHMGADETSSYECDDCGFTTGSYHEMQNHIDGALVTTSIQCNECDFSTATPDSSLSPNVYFAKHTTETGHLSFTPTFGNHSYHVNAKPGSCSGPVTTGTQTSGYMVISIATAKKADQVGVGFIKVAWNGSKVTVGEPVVARDPLRLYLFKAPLDPEYTDLKNEYELLEPDSDASLGGARYIMEFYSGEEYTTHADCDADAPTAVWEFESAELIAEDGRKYGYIDFSAELIGSSTDQNASAPNQFLKDEYPVDSYTKMFGTEGTYRIYEIKAPTGFRTEGAMTDFTNVFEDESYTPQDLLDGQANLKNGYGYTNTIASKGLIYVFKGEEGGSSITPYVAVNGELKEASKYATSIKSDVLDIDSPEGYGMYVAETYGVRVESYATWDDTNKKFIYPHDDLMAHEHIQISDARANSQYQVITELIDKDTGMPIINRGGNSTNPGGSDFTYNSSSAIETIIYTSGEGNTTEIELNVRIDTSVLTQTPDALAGHTLVFVNTVHRVLEDGTIDPATVKTLELESEELRLSKSGTELLDKNTGKHITHAIQGRVVYDTIIYENLEPEREYTVKAWLMDKDTNNYAVDAYGTPIVIAQNTVKQISSATGSGEWQIEYAFDAHFYEVNRLNMVQDWLQPGRTYVSFVEVYQGDELVLEYKDIDDENETIVIPRIRTELLDDKTKDHVSFAGGGMVTLHDTITYDHMLPGETYYVKTTLIDMNTGEPAIDPNGNQLIWWKGEAYEHKEPFVTTGSEGSWTVDLTFDASNLEGHVLVCYEEVFIDSAGVDQPDAEIAHHTDYFDRKQRMYFPYIDTYANDVKTGALIRGETNANANHNAFAEDEMVIQDLVRYEAVSIAEHKDTSASKE